MCKESLEDLEVICLEAEVTRAVPLGCDRNPDVSVFLFVETVFKKRSLVVAQLALFSFVVSSS